jgi:hypothetical protein
MLFSFNRTVTVKRHKSRFKLDLFFHIINLSEY